MDEKVSALLSSIDAAVLSKVKEIIEGKLKKSIAELEDLRISQFYERLVNQNTVYYEPGPLYVLDAIFLHARNVQHVTFSLTDEQWGGVTFILRQQFMRVVQRNPQD
jgi:hypothetical protein